MARPPKEGMDYFPHDVDAAGDEKVEALRAIYGNDGYAFYFILLERIYRTRNFELVVSDAEILQILARKVAVTTEKFAEMITSAIKWGCFDAEAYTQRGVLTSDGIKKRAAPVIEKRRQAREKYGAGEGRIPAAETTPETTPETHIVKESKVKESRVNSTGKSTQSVPDTPTTETQPDKTPNPDSPSEIQHRIFDSWNSAGIVQHRKLTDQMRRAINGRLETYTEAEVCQSISNYGRVLGEPDKFYFSYRWTLEHFLRRGFEAFLDWDVAAKNYASARDRPGRFETNTERALRTVKDFLKEEKE